AALIITFTANTVSAATRAAFADLAGQADGKPIGDRRLLAVLLARLEPMARKLLVDYGGVDLAQWLAEAAVEPPEPLDVFTAQGQLDLGAFTPDAQRVLSTLVAEASTLGYRELGTLLLLHAMAVEPNGLFAQACRFQRQNLHEFRAQVLRLLGGRRHRPDVEVTLAGDAIGPSLRLTLEKAAVHAAGRHVDLIGEPDLLSALLDSSVGPTDEVLRTAGLDFGELRQYAAFLYTAPPEPESVTAPELDSVAKSLDWLRDNLIGQDSVLDLLVPRLELIKRAARRGFRMGERPLATFLFCGPSGSGKTMTARLVAKVVYGSQDDLIVFDMGQFNS
ncbi:MAG: Clp protease N-terminal domain-containing protein, partial [Actinomycetes bacterium]